MEIRDVPEPTPGHGQVKIQVKAAGICGSDIHIYHSDIAIPVKPPVIVGHEFSGVIVETGPGVTGWKAGDRVTSETAFSFCGICDLCRSGFYNLCNERRTLGYWYDGAFAKYTIVPEQRLHRLADNIDFVTGAMIEPLACVTHAVMELTTIRAGDVVLVSGPGPIGLTALQLAKAEGATVVVSGTDIDMERLKMAVELGADHAVNIMETDLGEFVGSLTQGRGADVVLECSGVSKAADSALNIVKKQGQYTQIGLFGRPITIDFDKICYREIKVIGSLGSKWSSWNKAMQLVEQGKVKMLPLVSHRMPITQWENAFELFETKKGMKLMLLPED